MRYMTILAAHVRWRCRPTPCSPASAGPARARFHRHRPHGQGGEPRRLQGQVRRARMDQPRAARSCRSTTTAATCSRCRRSGARKDVVWLSVNSTNKSQLRIQDGRADEQLDAVAGCGAEGGAHRRRQRHAGRAYGAKTTPHMFVIDPQGQDRLRGAIDDKRTHARRRRQGRQQLRARGADRIDGGQAGDDAEHHALRLHGQVLNRGQHANGGVALGGAHCA